MEIVFGIIIVVLLLFLLGVSLGFISILFCVMVTIGLVAMLLFFGFSVLRLIVSEKKTARFDGTEPFGDTKFDCAVYLIEGERYKNAFPCEAIMRDRIYRKDKDVTVCFYERKKLVYDKNSVITAVAGAISSAILCILATILFFTI